jgi:hypothetical protein
LLWKSDSSLIISEEFALPKADFISIFGTLCILFGIYLAPVLPMLSDSLIISELELDFGYRLSGEKLQL